MISLAYHGYTHFLILYICNTKSFYQVKVSDEEHLYVKSLYQEENK